MEISSLVLCTCCPSWIRAMWTAHLSFFATGDERDQGLSGSALGVACGRPGLRRKQGHKEMML